MTKSTALKISLLWTPLLLWYLCGFFFTHTTAFFHQVDVFYYDAGQHWLHRQDLYDNQANMFVYLPTSAALFTELSLLPLKYFELVFRLISIFVITVGIFSFARDTDDKNPARVFFFSLLTTVFLSQPALFVGQLHIMTTGLMLLAFAAIAREKWWPAAILLTIALAFKPTSLILFLLGMGLFPKLSWRLLLSVLIAFLISLVLQSPHYVLSQYTSFADSFKVAMHHDGNNPQQWATLFGAIAFYTHNTINGFTQFAIRALAGLCVYSLCIIARIRCDKKTAIYFIVTLGMCYLMLFNSRTEDNDYVMVAPLLGYTLGLVVLEKKWLPTMAISLGVILMAANWNLCKFITPGNNIWINPTIIALFSVYIIYRLLQVKNVY